MKKKIIIPIIIVVVILAFFVGMFLAWEEEPELRPGVEIFTKAITAPGDDYEILETPEGKIVENKKDNLRIMVPEGWIILKQKEGIAFIHPQSELTPDRETGSILIYSLCDFSILINRCEKIDPESLTGAEYLMERIDWVQINPEWWRQDGYEVIEINQHKALKRTWYIPDIETEKFGKAKRVKMVEIEIPVGQRVYMIGYGNSFEDKESCDREFEEFLKNIVIE